MVSQRRIPILGKAEIVLTWDADNGLPGAPGALPTLDAFQRRLGGDPEPLMEATGRIMRRSFAEDFAVGGRPRWAPLASSTVAAKRTAIRAGAIPRLTPKGAVPRRLTQVDQATGKRVFGAFTTLIESGRLRDSWCQKGARGNVSQVRGGTLFVGSQYTITRTLAPGKPQRHYHILTKRAQAARQRGQAVGAQIPLARIHEQGAPGAHIPARPVAVVQPEDLDAIKAAALAWVFGDS